MTVRKVDKNNDWCFGAGKSSYVSEKMAIEQKIQTRLKEWQGNCFFDKKKGLNWNKLEVDKRYFDADVKKIILKTDGVLSISDYTSKKEDRNLKISCVVKTVYGKTEVKFG